MERYYYSIASSSAGNAALYVENKTVVLIDVGVSLRELTRALTQLDLCLADFSGVLITHEHTDHVKGLSMLCTKCDVPVFCSGGTAKALQEKLGLRRERLRVIKSDEPFCLGGLEAESFDTPHDARESTGFLIRSEKMTFGYATDLGFMPETVLSKLEEADMVVLESNHDRNMLFSGRYPRYLKERISGARGHLSNAECAEAALHLMQRKTKKLVLSHLSEQNNTPRLAASMTTERLLEGGVDVRYGEHVRVAPGPAAAQCYALPGGG